jgi:hypothetical protein
VVCCHVCVCSMLSRQLGRIATSACHQHELVTSELVTAGQWRCLSKRSLICWEVAPKIEGVVSRDCEVCMVSGKVLCVVVVWLCCACCQTLLFVLHNLKQTPLVSENENQAANLTPGSYCKQQGVSSAIWKRHIYTTARHVHAQQACLQCDISSATIPPSLSTTSIAV